MCGRLPRLRIAQVGVVRRPGVIRCPGAARCCTGAFLVGADVGCAVDLGAAPHAASPRKTPPGLEGSKGMRALVGAWGVLCFAQCRGRLGLERAHRQSREAKRPGQDAVQCGEAIELNGNRAACRALRLGGLAALQAERNPMRPSGPRLTSPLRAGRSCWCRS